MVFAGKVSLSVTNKAQRKESRGQVRTKISALDSAYLANPSGPHVFP